MTLFCLGIVVASLLSVFLPIVPPLFTLFILVPILLGAIWCRSNFIAGAILFISLWLIQTNHYYLTQKKLPLSDTTVVGTIIDSPKQYQDYSQIVLLLDEGIGKGYRVRLNWSQAPEQLAAGQRWQLPVRLKPIVGVANPAAINRESNAMLKRELLQGSVIQTTASNLLTAKMLSSQFMLRPYLIKQLGQATSELATAPLLKALTIGERHFNQQLWQGLQLSALAHLMAISGLHIGLIFIFSLWLSKPLFIIKNISARLMLKYSLALGCALLYAWLAGFAIPTIRASLALLIVVICKVQLRTFSYLQFWLLIVAGLLLFEPLFVISIGFWLSVLAVAIIFMLLWQQPKIVNGWRGKLLLFLRFHFYLTLMMTLFSIVFFNGGSLLALVSNIIFVPYTSMLAIPVLFVTLIAQLIQLPFSASLWQFTDWLFTPLLVWLDWCSQQNSWWAWPNINWLTVLLLGLALMMFWLTRHRLALLFTALVSAVISLTLWGTSIWQLHLIDVGQGLAVLLQKGQQGVLYDVGPRYNNYSATAAIVLPFLRQTGIRQLDYVVLSHNDSDHTGDWRLLQQQYPELRLITNIADINSAQPCADLNFNYLGAKVQLFTLFDSELHSKNDRSCLMFVDIDGWKILLTGDISARAERLLIAQQPNISADILLLAHHGSASSSDYGFLYHLAPLLALNSASLYNRHQHPSAIVRQRLSLLGIPLLNTATSGAISLDIKPENIRINAYRPQRLPYWQQKPYTNAETLLATR
ncbi:DNA internalization-related competence protein ComEC/Rec2 [Rheinheimera sp. MMS21-TC3]|uniref:DNA internalization-related competence protein ComEC/Rec2 n=1 Tax=Rheinheimera sp. MMS21-TC3 TaxID=3072790 RepID=UPI0028C48FE1|nr:DNA internalization-related competence protein ComEC/Rec2 [Rheinheimera sp. MMS21-TC3]WNO61199.1 DNA internalization-related competence protein ComEC/Rec2 [Rheinheimera sp. MMS21-TC3]